MNERIKELAEQAGFVLWQNESWRPVDVIDWSCRYDDELKKFAELIVKECCDVAHHNHFVNRLTLGDVINKHFGSKE